MRKLFAGIPHRHIVVPLLIAVATGAFAFFAVSTLAANRRPANACDSDICISLRTDGANPDTVSIPVGGYITFYSADGKSHSLSLGEGGEEHSHSGPFSSGEFKADEAWRVQFKEPGTFHFHDHLNPSINILVVAYEPDGDHSIR